MGAITRSVWIFSGEYENSGPTESYKAVGFSFAYRTLISGLILMKELHYVLGTFHARIRPHDAGILPAFRKLSSWLIRQGNRYLFILRCLISLFTLLTPLMIGLIRTIVLKFIFFFSLSQI